MKETTTVGSGSDRLDVEASLRDEVESLERILDQHERTIASLRRQVDLHHRSIGWRLQQRFDPLTKAMLGIPILRQIYRALYRAMEIWADEGFLKIFGRAAEKLGLVFRGKSFLVEGHDRRPPPIEDQYEHWIRHQGAAPTQQAMQASIATFTTAPRISILAILDDAKQVNGLIAMLKAQSYERWELCVAISRGSDGSLDPPGSLDSARRESRVRVTEVPASAWSDAFQLATGDYIGFLEPGDELAPAALFELVARLQSEPDLDVVYSDEDSITVSGRRVEPVFKPDWSPDLLLSTNYLQRFGIFRARAVRDVAALGPGAGLAQLYDLALRLTERTNRIAHVAKVLYHARRSPTTVDDVLARRAANRDESRVIVDALGRRGSAGRTTALFARKGARC
jgi:hypothetical protein